MEHTFQSTSCSLLRYRPPPNRNSCLRLECSCRHGLATVSLSSPVDREETIRAFQSASCSLPRRRMQSDHLAYDLECDCRHGRDTLILITSVNKKAIKYTFHSLCVFYPPPSLPIDLLPPQHRLPRPSEELCTVHYTVYTNLIHSTRYTPA